LDDGELFRRQLSWLPENVVGHADLPDVVQQSPDPGRFDVVGRQTHGTGDEYAVGRQALGVSARLGIARLQRIRQRCQRVEVAILDVSEQQGVVYGDRCLARLNGEHLDLAVRKLLVCACLLDAQDAYEGA